MSNWLTSRYIINKIYCSPLIRAYQTATYLSENINLPLYVDDMLMEFNNGLISGHDKKTVNEKYPFIDDLPVHSAVYEQESKLDFRFRADYILSKIIAENDEDNTIVIVSHGGMINQLFHSFLNLPINCNIFYSTGDTGIHEWLISNESRRIVFSNSCYHTLYNDL